MGVEINMKGKRAVVYGIANKHSIAWGVARALRDAGADVAVTYFNERLLKSVGDLAKELQSELVLECDACDVGAIRKVYEQIGNKWGGLDYIVHSVAFANRDDLGGDFSGVSREGFRTALETSAYSLIPAVAEAKHLFGDTGGAVLTMTFDASVRVYPGYNIMGTAKAALENEVRQLAAEYGPLGVRVNALSPGPISTLAARGISGFNSMKEIHRQRAPLRRNVSLDEVAQAGLFMLSDFSSGITGAILPVDAGFGILAV